MWSCIVSIMSAGKTRVTLKFSFKNNFSRRQMTQCQYDPGEGVRQTIISHLKVRLKCEPSLFKVLTPVTSAVQCILIQAPLLLRNSNWGFVKTRTVWEVEQSVTSCQTKQHFLSSSKTIKPRSDEAYFVDIKITKGRLGFYFLLQFSWRLNPVQPLNLGDNNVYHRYFCERARRSTQFLQRNAQLSHMFQGRPICRRIKSICTPRARGAAR